MYLKSESVRERYIVKLWNMYFVVIFIIILFFYFNKCVIMVDAIK